MLKWIKSLFKTNYYNLYQTDIEYFLKAKQPKSTAEVEYWIKDYEYHNQKSTYSWGRGL